MSRVDLPGPPDPADPQVRAGGGLVWRPATGEGVEILVVHRPRYDDWTLPKGKCDPGETYRDCARREVQEETGLTCRLGVELPDVRYVDHQGRTKRVRYWAMEVESGSFMANEEVDHVRWVAPHEATELLTYGHDVPVVEAFVALQSTSG